MLKPENHNFVEGVLYFKNIINPLLWIVVITLIVGVITFVFHLYTSIKNKQFNRLYLSLFTLSLILLTLGVIFITIGGFIFSSASLCFGITTGFLLISLICLTIIYMKSNKKTKKEQ
ncbi:hypothetical protein [Mesoplasma photuris]|uniref:hypothetical protein n=1 Tax=Mesoplasma photuris TaxID=217731 RepID=UPI0004E1180C|nr:hypothetical protein [Mesoplasma photuris]